jgi:hypothetical protein
VKLVDRVGEKYGRLTVVERAPNAANPKDTNARWLCKCECGKTAVAYGQDLKRGKVVSCGCWNDEKRFKHGLSRTHLHAVWRMMLDRCRNQNNPAYKSYGGRGIEVCERWYEFTNFAADVGDRPKGYQIDRIDNDGNYTPENCRWATPKQQINNRRNSVYLQHAGKNLTIEEWADATGIKQDTIRGRLRRGWDASKALSEPVVQPNLKE